MLRGDFVKDDSGSYAVITEQGSSASQMTAAKAMDVMARLPGCAGEAAKLAKIPPVGRQRQVPQVQTVLMNVEVPPARFVGTVVGVPVITQVITLIRQVTELAGFPQTQHIDKLFEVPAATQRHVPQFRLWQSLAMNSGPRWSLCRRHRLRLQQCGPQQSPAIIRGFPHGPVETGHSQAPPRSQTLQSWAWFYWCPRHVRCGTTSPPWATRTKSSSADTPSIGWRWCRRPLRKAERQTGVAADPQRRAVRRLAGVGEWGPGEEVLCAQRVPSPSCPVSLPSRWTKSQTLLAERRIIPYSTEIHWRLQNYSYKFGCQARETHRWLLEYRWVKRFVCFLDRFHSVYSIREKPPNGYMWSGERLTRKQLTSRPDHLWPELWTKLGRNVKLKERQKWSHEKPMLDNGRRGIHFIDLEDMEFKETIKNARRNLETPMAPAMPCKTSKKSKHGETRSKTDDFKWKFACILEASESTRMRMEESLPKYQRTILQEKEIIHCSLTIWYTNLFLCLKQWRYPQQK